MVSHQGWRSITRDACDLRDFRSHGDALKGLRWRILDSLMPPRAGEQSSAQPTPPKEAPQS